MKRTLLQLLCIFSTTALAQLPPALQGKLHVPVNGTVVSCVEAQITVAVTNLVNTTTGPSTGIARTPRGLRSVIIPGGQTSTGQVVVYTALRNYPQWQQVKVGDTMNVGAEHCYLMADTGTYRIVQWYCPPAPNAKTPRNVWQ